MNSLRQSGFTLIELAIVVTVIAILVAIAYPLYTDYVLRSRRSEALQALLDLSLQQEKFRANNPTYSSSLGTLCSGCTFSDYYDISLVGGTSSYTITADPVGTQTKDKQNGVDCDPLTINQSGTKTPPECWSW